MAVSRKCVDYDKLMAEFKRRGIRPAQAAEAIGYTPTVFAPSKVIPGLTEKVLFALEFRYGIGYDDIRPADKPEPEQMRFDTGTGAFSAETIKDAIVDLLRDNHVEALLVDIISRAVIDAKTWIDVMEADK